MMEGDRWRLTVVEKSVESYYGPERRYETGHIFPLISVVENSVKSYYGPETSRHLFPVYLSGRELFRELLRPWNEV